MLAEASSPDEPKARSRASIARTKRAVTPVFAGYGTGVNALRDALWRHPGPTRKQWTDHVTRLDGLDRCSR